MSIDCTTFSKKITNSSDNSKLLAITLLLSFFIVICVAVTILSERKGFIVSENCLLSVAFYVLLFLSIIIVPLSFFFFIYIAYYNIAFPCFKIFFSFQVLRRWLHDLGLPRNFNFIFLISILHGEIMAKQFSTHFPLIFLCKHMLTHCFIPLRWAEAITWENFVPANRDLGRSRLGGMPLLTCNRRI